MMPDAPADHSKCRLCGPTSPWISRLSRSPAGLVEPCPPETGFTDCPGTPAVCPAAGARRDRL